MKENPNFSNINLSKTLVKHQAEMAMCLLHLYAMVMYYSSLQ